MTFPVRYEPGYRHDWLKKSPDRDFGVENGVFKAGQGTIPEGTPLAWDADGLLVPWGATQSARCAINYYEVRTGTGGDGRQVEGAILTRRCWLTYANLKWKAGITAPQKAAAVAALAAQEMINKDEI